MRGYGSRPKLERRVDSHGQVPIPMPFGSGGAYRQPHDYRDTERH
jgi:hypothetical protein